MVIEVLYMSKNATTRHCTKLDFAIIYHFGHISCISGLFLFKIGSKCVDFEEYPKPVATSPIVLSLWWFFILKSMQPQLAIWLHSVAVWSNCSLFLVHATRPADTTPINEHLILLNKIKNPKQEHHSALQIYNLIQTGPITRREIIKMEHQ